MDIDATFSDLSEENLLRPAKILNTFSEQVILMLSPSSYLMVVEYVKSKVEIKYELEKLKDKNQSAAK